MLMKSLTIAGAPPPIKTTLNTNFLSFTKYILMINDNAAWIVVYDFHINYLFQAYCSHIFNILV